MNVEIQRKACQKFFRMGLIASLILHLFIFHTSRRLTEPKPIDSARPVKFEIINFSPVTMQKLIPSKPVIPVPGENENLPELTNPDIFFFDVESTVAFLLPPRPAEDPWGFRPHEVAPAPIGGYEAIFRNLVYPDIARKAGIQGKVVIAVLIDKYGNIMEIKVEKSLPGGCDEAAIEAVKAVKWKPAMQRDEPVEVAIRIPVRFKLAN